MFSFHFGQIYEAFFFFVLSGFFLQILIPSAAEFILFPAAAWTGVIAADLFPDPDKSFL